MNQVARGVLRVAFDPVAVVVGPDVLLSYLSSSTSPAGRDHAVLVAPVRIVPVAIVALLHDFPKRVAARRLKRACRRLAQVVRQFVFLALARRWRFLNETQRILHLIRERSNG